MSFTFAKAMGELYDLQNQHLNAMRDIINSKTSSATKANCDPHVAYYSIEGSTISYVGTTLSVENVRNNKIITLYPNPTSSNIFIGGEFNKVRLYDLFGRELLKSTSNQLDLSNLPNNVYMIKLEDNQGKIIVTGKVVKN